MEMADMLHALYLGTARDTTGSLCLDYIEFCPSFAGLETYDQRLAALLDDIRSWCQQNGIRPSTIEDLRPLVCNSITPRDFTILAT